MLPPHHTQPNFMTQIKTEAETPTQPQPQMQLQMQPSGIANNGLNMLHAFAPMHHQQQQPAPQSQPQQAQPHSQHNQHQLNQLSQSHSQAQAHPQSQIRMAQQQHLQHLQPAQMYPQMNAHAHSHAHQQQQQQLAHAQMTGQSMHVPSTTNHQPHLQPTPQIASNMHHANVNAAHLLNNAAAAAAAAAAAVTAAAMMNPNAATAVTGAPPPGTAQVMSPNTLRHLSSMTHVASNGMLGFPPTHPVVPGNHCQHCGMDGFDVKVHSCGCLLHSRCVPVVENVALTTCPACSKQAKALFLVPMNFHEIDQAKAAAANMSPSMKRGKKRKNATIARLNPTTSVDDASSGDDLRTGRWTTEETAYCDKLIEKFEAGHLPLMEGIKLNDFLSSMLKSKQSRLTKKMKNARLSAKTYKRNSGHIGDRNDARLFSELEVAFFKSIQCDLERAEIRFHMQKEWREMFSSYCVAIGQKLDADDWLSSVEEMDRRASQAKDAARMARRKVMMGYALSQDTMNPERGVFIDKNTNSDSTAEGMLSRSHASTNSLVAMAAGRDGKKKQGPPRSIIRNYSSPFVGKVIQYIHRHAIPFEHIDAWVPSFVPHTPDGADAAPPQDQAQQQKCRLCFAGCATTDTQISPDTSRPVTLESQDQFDLLSFGEYSQKFSFDVGCGLPGRVYSSGICSWEQGVENAPSRQFERCGGASQWGIKTVLGVPIPSPNVGRIVILFYSRFDRRRDPDMVRRITEELTKLMPTPKWKLVVDVAAAPPRATPGKPVDARLPTLLKLMSENIPTHKNSAYAPYLPGFTSLRLLLMKQNKAPQEETLLANILESYSSHLKSSRNPPDIAWMIARDYMLLSQTMAGSNRQQYRASAQRQQQPQQHHLPHLHQQQPPQQNLRPQMVSQAPTQATYDANSINTNNTNNSNASSNSVVAMPNSGNVANSSSNDNASTSNMQQQPSHVNFAPQSQQQQQQQGMAQLSNLLRQQAYSPALTPIMPSPEDNIENSSDNHSGIDSGGGMSTASSNLGNNRNVNDVDTHGAHAAMNHLTNSTFSLHQSAFPQGASTGGADNSNP